MLRDAERSVMKLAGKTTKKSPNKRIETLRQIGQSLRRLVELVESLLEIPRQSTMATGVATDSEPFTSPRSVRRSTRSENGTDEGVIDLSRESTISFAEASGIIPTQPHPSKSTISRWCTYGCRGIKLESMFIGGRRKTTREAVQRFLQRCREGRWAGMHGSTGYFLEQAMANKEEQVSEQSAIDDASHYQKDQSSEKRAQTGKTARRSPRTDNSPGRSNRQKRGTKQRRGGL